MRPLVYEIYVVKWPLFIKMARTCGEGGSAATYNVIAESFCLT